MLTTGIAVQRSEDSRHRRWSRPWSPIY